MRVRASSPYPALLVPDRAVATDQAEHFIWVVNQENKVEYRKVSLGAPIGQYRVITSGLTAQEWIIIEGLQKMMPGVQVNPERISLTPSKAE
jgi:multidrug efflux system membrane fusion protein